MTTYLILKFDNREDFIAYSNTVKLTLKNIAYQVPPNDPKFAVFIKTELPVPKGLLFAETNGGKKVVIHVSSCTIKDPWISHDPQKDKDTP
jgi:hypothetical protein